MLSEQIRRPTHSAYIRLINADTGAVVDSIDTSNEAEAVFKPSAIRYTLTGIRDDTVRYKLQLDTGIAVGTDSGCMFDSAPSTWFHGE